MGLRKSAPKVKFGSSSRPDLNAGLGRDSPAPGHYELKSQIGDGLSKSFSSRTLLQIEEKTPGPGHYSQTKPSVNLKSSPEVRFGSGNRQIDHSNDSPEPGKYNPDYLSVGRRAPSFTMGLDKRADKNFEKAKGEVPGPGKYELISLAFDHRRPRFHIGSKIKLDPIEKERNSVPGPGTYQSSDF